jgi:putative membrane protein
MRLLVHWLLSAVALMLVARFVPGFTVSGFFSALIAAVVIGFVNGTLGFFLKVVTFPFTIITFGIFLLFINALMLRVAAFIVPGFGVEGFGAAFKGAILLALLNMLIRWVMKDKEEAK